jgi:transcriptional regulator GlxA family with amidase domain
VSTSRRGKDSHTMGDLRVMDARVESVINIIRQRVGDRLPIRVLSRSVNLSPSRLRQLFTKETGRSPMQYFRDVRMQHAEHILLSTFFSIKEIAFMSGIRDVSTFVRDFKKRYGLTPTEFRTRGGSALDGSLKNEPSGE